jgi:hypothetical protein
LTKLLRPLACCHSPAQRRIALETFVRLLERTGTCAPDDVGTLVAELPRNQIMSYVVVLE